MQPTFFIEPWRGRVGHNASAGRRITRPIDQVIRRRLACIIQPNASPVILEVMRQALKAALVALTIIAPAREALSATITVHEPDGEGRVFVDVVGQNQ